MIMVDSTNMHVFLGSDAARVLYNYLCDEWCSTARAVHATAKALRVIPHDYIITRDEVCDPNNKMVAFLLATLEGLVEAGILFKHPAMGYMWNPAVELET